MPQGSFGTIKAFNDFTSLASDVTIAALATPLPGGVGWSMVTENVGSNAEVVDESGGILKCTTDTGDNDNVVIVSGKFDASKGPITFESRFKVADDIANTAVFAGFTETLALDTPVMPAEFATATMTYNGSGGMLGLQWDSDATTNAWKAVCGDGGAVSGKDSFGANGTDATDAMVVDEFDIVRVVLHPGGGGEVWHDDELVASGATGLTTSDLFYAILMIETRTGAALELDVDYVYAEAVRDWAVD